MVAEGIAPVIPAVALGAAAMTAAGLVDEYRIMLFPTVVGSGARLFADVSDTAFGLEGVITTSTGVAVLTYLRSDGS